MRVLPSLLVLGLLALPACAVTPDTSYTDPATAIAEAEAAPKEDINEEGSALDPDEIICKKDKKTGSRLRDRETCLSRKEWDKKREDSKDAIDTMTESRPFKGN